MSLRDVWQKLFDTFVWYNFPSTSSPVNAANLNKMNTAIDGIDDRVLELKTGLDGVTEDLEDKVDKEQGKGLSTNDYDNTAKGIVDGVTSALDDKVDKEQGKGLSTEDFTTTEKTKLAGISAQANKVEITPVVTEGTTLATISIDGVDTDIKGIDIDVDDELSPTSENPVQNKVINSALADINTAISTKADKDGNYEQMTVGNAEQLTSNIYEEDSVPYNFRTSGGTLEIGDREYDTLVGGTIAFNQLCKNGNFADTSEWVGNNADISASNNKLTVKVTVATTGVAVRQNNVFNNKYNHIFIVSAIITAQKAIQPAFYIGENRVTSQILTANVRTKVQVIGKSNASYTNNRLYIYVNDNSVLAVDDEVIVENVMVIDLTQMFGSTIADYIYSLEQATAGSGVAYFRSLFPKDYYDYNAGQLMSVKALSHKMVGFNQWDEQWEVGSIESVNGLNVPDNTRYRTKNYIRLIEGSNYYFKFNGTDIIGLRFYDANKSYIGYFALSNLQNALLERGTNRLPANAVYLRFVNVTTKTYNNDICINLHWDGERDGEYEAYEEHIYPLDSDLELRGIPKLDSNNKLYYDGDTYESDGTVTRKYGIVDLGTLSWVDGSAYGENIFACNLASIASGANFINLICSKYPSVLSSTSWATMPDKTIKRFGNASSIGIKDSSYTDATTFKTAMSGVYLVYELARPTTETADTFQNPQIVSNWGTEEYTDSRTIQIPVGHITKYPPDLKAKLESAPDSPSSDGDYVLRHNNGENTYVSLEKELPTVPTTDGTYVLKATASSGTATLSWVAE